MPRLQGHLAFDGAIINVRVELGAAEEAHLQSTGQPVPPAFPTTALIDPGASVTAIDPMILNYLGVQQTGAALVSVPGHANANTPLFDVRISLGNHRPPFAVQVARIVPAARQVGSGATVVVSGNRRHGRAAHAGLLSR